MCANCLECIILQLAQQEDDPHVLQRLLVPGPGASDCISGGCVVDPTADNEEEVGHIRPLATDLQDTTGLKGLSSSLVSRLAYKRKKLQYQYRSAGAFNHRNSTLNLSRLSTKWAPIIKNFYNVVKFIKNLSRDLKKNTYIH